jgi:glutathionylspermidine synthase
MYEAIRHPSISNGRYIFLVSNKNFNRTLQRKFANREVHKMKPAWKRISYVKISHDMLFLLVQKFPKKHQLIKASLPSDGSM